MRSILVPTILAILWAQMCVGCRLWQVTAGVDGPTPTEPGIELLTSQLNFDVWKRNTDWTPWDEWSHRRGHFPVSHHLRWMLPDAALESELAREFDNGRTARDSEDRPNNADGEPLPAEPSAAGDLQTESSESGIPRTSEITAGHLTGKMSPDPTSAASESLETAPDSADRNWLVGIDRILAGLEASGTRQADSSDSSGPTAANRHLAQLAKRDDLVGWNAAILWARRDPVAASRVASILESLVTEPPSYDPQTGRRTGTNTEAGEDDSGFRSRVQRIVEAAANRPAQDAAESADEKPAGPSQTLSTSTQLAAAEAWCLVLAAGSEDPADGLAPAGRLLEKPDLPLPLRVELFLGISRWIPPVRVPLLAESLEHSRDGMRAPLEARRAAIDAQMVHALWNLPQPNAEPIENRNSAHRVPFDSSLWPRSHTECEFDPDSHVRESYAQWLVATNHPRAFETLKSQLLDTNVRVRHAALIGLGRLGTPDARDALRREAGHPKELIRSHAVRGLAHWGVAEIADYARDESFPVRLVVAEELGRHPGIPAARFLWDLLIDSNPQVQLAVVNAVDDWPDDLALPLLLHGMQDSSSATRLACFKRLQKRTEMDQEYRFDAPPEERQQSVTRLALKQGLPLTFLERFESRGLGGAPRIDALHAAEVTAHLERFLHEPSDSEASLSALEWLRQLGPEDIPAIERFVIERKPEESRRLYRELLPQLSPAYAALLDVENEDVFIRRRGTRALSQLAAGASLSSLVVHNLRTRLIDEQDRWVWRLAMQAIMPDATEANARIALLAINHPWPDIRQLGCEYVERHRQPRHAVWLLPLLQDPNRDVQVAAIRAVGYCRNPVVLDGFGHPQSPRDLSGLRSLLTHADRTVQLATIVSMSRLGDPQGMQELVRLTYHESRQTRQRAVAEMGASGQPWFVKRLIDLAWIEPDETVKREILNSLDRLVVPEKRPAGLSRESGVDAKIKMWAAWNEQRSAQPDLQEFAARSSRP